MKFIKRAPQELFLRDTAVENIFIGEYMTSAPADYVKVYLFALMHAEASYYIDNEKIAKQLFLEIEDVLKAWTYWEQMGVVKKINKNRDNKFDYTVEFVDQKTLLYGKSEDNVENIEKNDLIDNSLKLIYDKVEKITGRLLTGKEPLSILSWIEDFGATEDIIIGAYEYCKKSKNKDDVSYIEKVVKKWSDKGLHSKEELEQYLEEMDQRYYQYKRIMKFLGFNRNVTEAEKNIIDKWFDEMGFTIDKVLEACNKTSGISNPNINYINKILENWWKDINGKTFDNQEKKDKNTKITQKDIEQYYSEIRVKREAEAKERIAKIYKELPEIEFIDKKIRTIGFNISKIMLSGGKNKLNDLKLEIEKLNKDKNIVLNEMGYTLDSMEVEYLCNECRDTGFNDDGERCKCYHKRFEELKNGR